MARKACQVNNSSPLMQKPVRSDKNKQISEMARKVNNKMIVDMIETGYTYEETARKCRCSKASVSNVMQKYRENQKVAYTKREKLIISLFDDGCHIGDVSTALGISLDDLRKEVNSIIHKRRTWRTNYLERTSGNVRHKAE